MSPRLRALHSCHRACVPFTVYSTIFSSSPMALFSVSGDKLYT